MASYQYVYVMKDLRKIYPGGKQVLKDIWLSFYPGAKIGVLGLNGAGKSTLLRSWPGVDDSSPARPGRPRASRSATCRRSRSSTPTRTCAATSWRAPARRAALLARFDEITAAFGEPDAEMDKLLDEQAELQDKIDAANAWDLDRTLEIAMDALRCPPADADVDKLSGGERRRVALCRLLLQKPDMLLLDEPTNHLDAESVAWLEHHLHEYPGTVVAVTHDRYFLDNVAGWILELDRGQGIPWEGNYSSWLEQKHKRLALEEKTARRARAAHAAARAGMGARMSAAGPPGQEQGPHRRLRELLAEDEPPEARRPSADPHPARPAPRRPGGRGRDICQGLRRPACSSTTSRFRLPPGGIVGVIGPNGAGKTTLFRMIIGQEKPDSGTFTVGETVKLAYVDQSRDALDADKTVCEEISGGHDIIELGKREMLEPRLRCGSFNFKGADQQKKVGQLSGGERNRVHLAKMLKSGGNVLLLDEPTNDLDVDTLRALEEALRRLRRLRRGHQPRPLVPRPHRHPHPGLRGRQPGRLVRGQLPGLRGRPQAPPRRRRRPAAPHQVQAAGEGLGRGSEKRKGPSLRSG